MIACLKLAGSGQMILPNLIFLAGVFLTADSGFTATLSVTAVTARGYNHLPAVQTVQLFNDLTVATRLFVTSRPISDSTPTTTNQH
jgi:hypothetical protein